MGLGMAPLGTEPLTLSMRQDFGSRKLCGGTWLISALLNFLSYVVIMVTIRGIRSGLTERIEI